MGAAQYTYEAMWSQTDRAFIARVREFPSMEARGESRGSSIRALRNVVAAVVKDLVESGQEIPPRANAKKGSKK
jgi:predicted RNase H-like HicB family nuclease